MWRLWHGISCTETLRYMRYFICKSTNNLYYNQIPHFALFKPQTEIMDMKEEMMNDAIDDAMGEDDDEEER